MLKNRRSGDSRPCPWWIPALKAFCVYFSCLPLAAMGLLGIWLLLWPAEMYGALHREMFSLLPERAWEAIMLTLCVAGYRDIHKGGKLWKVAMGGCFVMYLVLAAVFIKIQGVAGPAFSICLCINSLLRLTNLWQPVQGFRKPL